MRWKCGSVYIGNLVWFARALSYWGHVETARFRAGAEEKNSMSCVITASAPTNDHAQIRICMLRVLQTAGLCYAQPLNNCIFTACEYSFETNPFCHATTKFTCQYRLRNFGRIPFITNSSSMYTKICLRHKLRTFLRNWC